MSILTLYIVVVMPIIKLAMSMKVLFSTVKTVTCTVNVLSVKPGTVYSKGNDYGKLVPALNTMFAVAYV